MRRRGFGSVHPPAAWYWGKAKHGTGSKITPMPATYMTAYAYFRPTLRMMMLSDRLNSSFFRSESRSTVSHIFAM